MPDLGRITRQKPVPVVIDLGEGDTINLTFDLNRVTPAWAHETQMQADANDALAVARALSAVILTWDVTDEDREFPPTPENIGRLPLAALRALMEKIMEAAVPSSEEGNGSGDTSSSPAQPSMPQQASLQNGPAPSPSPPLSASPSTT